MYRRLDCWLDVKTNSRRNNDNVNEDYEASFELSFFSETEFWKCNTLSLHSKETKRYSNS